MQWGSRALPVFMLPAAVLALAACDAGDDLRGTTSAARPLPSSASPPRVPGSDLIPGGATREITLQNPYWRDPDAIRDGQRLYGWYNCSGCHAGGGGGMGPPLMDDKWIYGSRPVNLFDVIVEGRPGGMPAFGSKMPDDQIWKIIAYIESMGGMQYRNETAASGAEATVQ
jgi:cytochrome c oxidase cbb3-type subunit 3